MIRAISVSLLAVAALVTSILLSRSRHPEAAPTLQKTGEASGPAAVSLDELRSAGF